MAWARVALGILLLLGTALPARADDEDAYRALADDLIRHMAARFEQGVWRIAVAPIDQSLLPLEQSQLQRIAGGLERGLQQGLLPGRLRRLRPRDHRSRPLTIQLVENARLGEVLANASFTVQRDVTAVLEQAERIDALILLQDGAPLPRGGVRVSFRASGVGERGQGLVFGVSRPVRLDDLDLAPGLRFQAALVKCAAALADQLQGPQRDAALAARVRLAGAAETHPFLSLAARQFQARLREQARGGQSARAGLTWVVSAADLGDRVDLLFVLQDASWAVVDQCRTAVRADDPIFDAYPPLKAATGPDGPEGQTAEAAIGADFRRTEAEAAAVMLARARLIAIQVGEAPPPIPMVRTGEQAIGLMRYLELGLPYRERVFRAPGGDSGRTVRVQVAAKIRTLATDRAFAPEAEVQPNSLRAGDVVRVRLRGTDRPIYFGLYAWSADDRVVRLIPGPATQEGEAALLPARADRESAWHVAPLPGAAVSNEAFLLVWADRPFDAGTLAGPAGRTLEESLANAVYAGPFFDRLADLVDRGLRLKVLPYAVRQSAR